MEPAIASEDTGNDHDESVPVVKAALAKKKPPPEAPDQIWRRRWIILSFWVVVLFIGLPVWVWTTTVHRATLPVDSMHKWASGQACRLEFPLYAALESQTLDVQETHQLAKLVQQNLDDHDISSLHHLRVSAAANLDRVPDVTVKLAQSASLTAPRAHLQQYDPVLDIEHAQVSSTLAPLAVFVANELRSLFGEEQTRLAHLLTRSGYNTPNARISPEIQASLDERSTRSFKYSSTYHLTFSLFAGSSSPSAWDIKAALDDYLAPLLAAFSSISDFTIDTQIQLYASLPPSMHGPTYDEAAARWTLERSDLSGFINAAEWPLSPSIGEGPTINFVLYVPSTKQSPLVIEGSGGTSWLIPQWGGVQILNRDALLSNATITKEQLFPVVLTFADQLTSLLSLPHSPASLPLRLSSLTRERATSLILSASSTLGALARLSMKLTAIAIPDNVAVSVDKTIHHLEQACSDLRGAHYDSALSNARIAEAEAEKAFFNPSMVGQVYFPDEHKVAVYVPLLGPMAVPLIMAALKEIKKMRQRP